MLHLLRQQPELEVVGLLTTINEAFDRVAMHAVRRELLEAQARAARLELWAVPLPWPCSNEEYEKRMDSVIVRAKSEGVKYVAFGDLFLEDIRRYRIEKLSGTGIDPIFPLWERPTGSLAGQMIAGGLEAVLTCVDPKQMDRSFVGRSFDRSLLAELPSAVDPCGENGEFHTFCYAGPMFSASIPIRMGERAERDGFWFADVLPG
jgi:uncharacterized protein (TIGR00290 family)